VDELTAEGHQLVPFITNKAGQYTGKLVYYQCIMDTSGRDAGYRYFWRPGEWYKNVEIVGNTEKVNFFTVAPWPQYPGGLMFRLNVIEPENEHLTRYDRINFPQTYQDEIIYLQDLKDQGKMVIGRWVRPDELVRAMAELAGAQSTRQAVDIAVKYVQEHTTVWPVPVKDAASVQ
jgi:hypothetical protein